jgi:uncharacterized protein YyaL (SSP411 family)
METKTINTKTANALIHETSPYLLQHAFNPVNWYAWDVDLFNWAKKEDKLILISIGYSACHWCHVMEKESFEDEAVAALMNEHFINIKIDREERPDIDQVYMSAVQLMTGQGGWPLNCFVLPDGRPIYGGTYFPKHKWLQLLKNLVALKTNNPNKVYEYAGELINGMLKVELINTGSDKKEISKDYLLESVNRWKKLLDHEDGGMQKAPKFPLPNNYLFLLRYAHLTNDHELMNHVHLTLIKMAFGGIYDQLGGGFARYSVDAIWKVPHFEKMLYDNAQLITLYAEAYQQSKNELFKKVVFETLDFIKTELKSASETYYSALDADSEGVEGKYYTWTKEELTEILNRDEYHVFINYYNINEIGYWEDENYILLKTKTIQELSFQLQISISEIDSHIESAKQKLKQVREKRIKPGLDDKQLCSWNALLIISFITVYKVFNHENSLEEALKLAEFLKVNFKNKNGLYHSFKNGKAKINGFLEDYAFLIEAYITLYEQSGKEEWLKEAKRLTDYTISHFYDETSGYFYFTSDEDPELIVRKTELSDNVIPASNSQMARNLFRLHKHYYLPEYEEMAKRMLSGMLDEISHYGSGYSNWAILLMEMTYPFNEIVFTGKNHQALFSKFQHYYQPNSIIARAFEPSELPLIHSRFDEHKSLIYICENQTCQLPLNEINDQTFN